MLRDSPSCSCTRSTTGAKASSELVHAGCSIEARCRCARRSGSIVDALTTCQSFSYCAKTPRISQTHRHTRTAVYERAACRYMPSREETSHVFLFMQMYAAFRTRRYRVSVSARNASPYSHLRFDTPRGKARFRSAALNTQWSRGRGALRNKEIKAQV